MSVDATLDSTTHALLAVDNVKPLSFEQQQLYDPDNFANSSLGTSAWNGFSVDPDIDANVPAPLIDQLNNWINLTISVYVGGEWLNRSTVQSNVSVTDIPEAYSEDLQQYYLSTLTNFYQAYLTLLAAGSYFIDAPLREQTAHFSGFQTRQFVSTPACWALIVALVSSTTLTFLANLRQPHIALPIGTSPNMLITAMKLGRSPYFIDHDLRQYDLEQLNCNLGDSRIMIEEGEVREYRENL